MQRHAFQRVRPLRMCPNFLHASLQPTMDPDASDIASYSESGVGGADVQRLSATGTRHIGTKKEPNKTKFGGRDSLGISGAQIPGYP